MRNINWHNLEAGYLIKQFFLYFSHSGSGVIKSTSHSIFVSPIFIISLVVFILLLLLFRWIYVLWRATTEKSILLELTPPAFTDKSAYTTKELFSVIHGLGKHQRLLERFLGIKPKLSFEIVSTKDQGIRYVVRTTPHYANNFKRYMLSYLPQVQVKETNEYLAKGLKESKKYQSRITEFKLDRHFAYPLKRQDTLSEHDPVAYITGMMTKLTPNELISFQIVLSPTKTNETHHIKRMILHNENVLAYLDSFQLPVFLKPIVVVLRIFSALIFKLGSEFQWAVSELMHPDTQPVYLRQNYAYQQMQIQQQIKPARTLTSFEETTIQSIQEKIDQPLFETTIRLLVMVKDNEEQKERIDGFVSSMETYAVSGYQSLVKKSLLSDIVFGRIRKVTFNKRLLSLMGSDGSSLLSSSEIADLYHFPFSTITQTESLVKSHSRELPVPVSLKQTAKLDVLVGQNTYGGEITPIGLRLPERYRHAYILGGTGCGKSTMLFYMIMQDIKAGKGVILIDPHGDLAQLIGRSIPKERLKDVIYWDPMDISHPVRLNLLQRTPGLDEDEAALEKELIVEHIISIFRKVFSTELSSTEVNAIRIERMFRNALYTAL